MTQDEAKHRAAFEMSATGRGRAATRLMLAAWREAAEALNDGGRGTVADLEAMAKLRESEQVAEVVADGVFDGPGARMVAQRRQVVGHRHPFSIS
ncbi:hypothetical protein [Streptomyces sp. SID12501]|uniref:Uncharacterized protein n=1 Tax=Streptomyces sp. SID12501 TaxID=2706042 RepID=A0A6B3C6Z6_9ACTN|nr:hypothetical protein [Streptomyces sp. SID12501]NEC92196.1 hypothetical protein [Streptomyces sp. SID12501]